MCFMCVFRTKVCHVLGPAHSGWFTLNVLTSFSGRLLVTSIIVLRSNFNDANKYSYENLTKERSVRWSTLVLTAICMYMYSVTFVT